MKRTKTYSLKKAEIDKVWHVLDAEGQTLGRLSTEVARLLMGKHKPTYAPHLDMGDFVVVVNAEKIRVTGKKLDDKTYRHTGYVWLPRRPRSPTCFEGSRSRCWRSHERHAPSQQTQRGTNSATSRSTLGRTHPHQAQQARRPEERKRRAGRCNHRR